MSSISKCPRCEQPVTIPEAVAAEAQVRCPLCDAEYPLSDALAGVPPALIVVEPAGVGVGAAVAESVALEAMGAIAPLPAVSESAAAEGEVAPDGEAAPTVEGEVETETAAEPAAEAAPETGEGVAEAAGGVAETTEEMAAEVEHELDLVSDEAPEATAEVGGETAVETERETFDAAAFTGIGQEPAGDGKEPPPGVARWRTRRNVKEKNPVKEVVGIVLGGFLGLLIGYYVLAWAGVRGLPKIPLPFLPSKHSPKTEDENKTDADAEKTESRAPMRQSPFDRFAA